MKVIVRRSTGDKQSSEAIVDVLCNTLTPAVARGQNYLYQEGFDKLLYDLVIPFRAPLICGDTVQMDDASIGESFKSRLSGWSISADLQNDTIQIDQQLSLERSIVDE